jgi:hypothetical protein
MPKVCGVIRRFVESCAYAGEVVEAQKIGSMQPPRLDSVVNCHVGSIADSGAKAEKPAQR